MSEAIGAGVIDFTRPRRSFAVERAGVIAWARSNWEIALLLVVASAVYQPWNIQYLRLTDFGIFLAERGTSHSLWQQLVGISSYYITEGRLLLFEYVHMTLGSAAFGTWAAGWHWSYFVIMSLLLVIARSFFLMSGANRTATFVALALFATMRSVAEGWLMPMGEPIALMFFMLAMRLALNYCDATDWKRRALLIAGCAVGIVFAKELLAVLLPVGWLASRLRFRDRQWEWARWTERDTFLLKVVTASVVAALIPVAYVFAHAPVDSYASRYGDSQPWTVTLERLETVLIPATPRLRRLVNLFSDPGFTILLALPSLLWLRLIAGGIAAGRKRVLWPAVIGALWVAVGVAAYFPWPIRAGYYMLPFALGTMFIGAHALTTLLEKNRSARIACLIVSGILLAGTSFDARSALYQHQMRAQLNTELIDRIASLGGTDVLIAAGTTASQARGGWATQLKGFGSAANGMKIGEARDMLCADAKRALATTPGAVVVSSASGCGPLTSSSTYVSARVPSWQWPYLWKPIITEGRMYISTTTGNPKQNGTAIQ